MVDTLVLGTSAKAWEFESLHAQTFNNEPHAGSFFVMKRGVSAVGSARHWQCRGQGFESPTLHKSFD